MLKSRGYRALLHAPLSTLLMPLVGAFLLLRQQASAIPAARSPTVGKFTWANGIGLAAAVFAVPL